MANRKRKGYAKFISGYDGQKYALFNTSGKRVGTSSMTGSEADHIKELRRSGYSIRKGWVRG